jgi:low affinity Fe/Cu permease
MSQPSPDEMQRNIEEIAALRASTRNWRLGMILGILIIVITCVMLIVNSVRALAEKGPVQEALLKDLKTGMETQVVPPVKQLAQRTMRDLEKSLKKEADKAAERAPEIMEAFNKELETLQTNIPKRGEEVLKSAARRRSSRCSPASPIRRSPPSWITSSASPMPRWSI